MTKPGLNCIVAVVAGFLFPSSLGTRDGDYAKFASLGLRWQHLVLE
jgi:hypothetical protein